MYSYVSVLQKNVEMARSTSHKRSADNMWLQVLVQRLIWLEVSSCQVVSWNNGKPHIYHEASFLICITAIQSRHVLRVGTKLVG